MSPSQVLWLVTVTVTVTVTVDVTFPGFVTRNCNCNCNCNCYCRGRGTNFTSLESFTPTVLKLFCWIFPLLFAYVCMYVCMYVCILYHQLDSGQLIRHMLHIGIQTIYSVCSFLLSSCSQPSTCLILFPTTLRPYPILYSPLPFRAVWKVLRTVGMWAQAQDPLPLQVSSVGVTSCNCNWTNILYQYKKKFMGRVLWLV